MYIHLNLIGYVCLGVDVGVEGPMVVRGLILPILAPALAVGNRYLVVVAAQGAPQGNFNCFYGYVRVMSAEK